MRTAVNIASTLFSLFSSKQIHTTVSQAPKKGPCDDRSWINGDQPKPISMQPPVSPHDNGTPPRRPAPSPLHQQDVPVHRQGPSQHAPFHNGELIEEHQSVSRLAQQKRDTDAAAHRHPPSKPSPFVSLALVSTGITTDSCFRKLPIRTTINSHNNRVLSVSGKLRCSRCQDELGRSPCSRRHRDSRSSVQGKAQPW